MIAAVAAAVLAAAGSVPGAAGPVPPDAPVVRLAVKGDWGYGGEAQAAVSRRICGEHRRARFAAVVTTGDNFYDPDGVATRENFSAPERCILLARIPYRAAWGNHDLGGGDTAAVLGAPRRHYAFTAGPARVIVLDSNAPDDPAQMRFLRRETRPGGTRPRIAVFHHPIATAGSHRADESLYRLWAPLLRRGRVALVLQGHNHHYERIERDGLTILTSGGGGAPVYPCLIPVAGLRTCRPVHHFLSVTVTRSAVAVTAIRHDGVVIDRFRVPAPAVA
ncbi:MAG: metallophosphoesterase family protein [Thermoleophilia bacterium]